MQYSVLENNRVGQNPSNKFPVSLTGFGFAVWVTELHIFDLGFRPKGPLVIPHGGFRNGCSSGGFIAFRAPCSTTARSRKIGWIKIHQKVLMNAQNWSGSWWLLTFIPWVFIYYLTSGFVILNLVFHVNISANGWQPWKSCCEFFKHWTIYSAITILEKCRKVVLEKWFCKLRFFFCSTTFLQPEKS